MNGKSKYEPAFPQSEKRYVSGFCGSSEEVVQNILGGMSLRDYFAAKAMQAMVGSREYTDGAWEIHSITGQAYEMADAMLKERAK